MLDYAWTAYDAYQAGETIANDSASAEEKLQAVEDLAILATAEAASTFGPPLVDDLLRHAPEALGALKNAVKSHMHHTTPRQIRKSRSTGKSMLPDHLVEHPDIKGKRGNPNRWEIPADEHIDLHKKNRAGGDFNGRWADELAKLKRNKSQKEWTAEDIMEIRDRLTKEFNIEGYRP